jgi:hypothetical protein
VNNEELLGLQGRMVPPRRPPRDALHRLLAAILLQALSDALGGDPSAIAWMDDCAPQIGEWLGLDRGRLAAWRTLSPDACATPY